MPKPTVTFMCSECGGESLRWAGQCPHCRAWNTLQEFQVRKAPAVRSGRAQGGPSGRSQAAEPRGSRPVPLSEIEGVIIWSKVRLPEKLPDVVGVE